MEGKMLEGTPEEKDQINHLAFTQKNNEEPIIEGGNKFDLQSESDNSQISAPSSQGQPDNQNKSMLWPIILICILASIIYLAIVIAISNIFPCTGELCYLPPISLLLCFAGLLFIVSIAHLSSLIVKKQLRPIFFYFIIFVILAIYIFLSPTSFSYSDSSNKAGYIDLLSVLEIALLAGFSYIVVLVSKNKTIDYGQKTYLLPLVIALILQPIIYFSQIGGVIFRNEMTPLEKSNKLFVNEEAKNLTKINTDRIKSGLPAGCSIDKFRDTSSYKVGAIKCELDSSVQPQDSQPKPFWQGDIAVGILGDELFNTAISGLTDANISKGELPINNMVTAKSRVMIIKNGAYYLELNWQDSEYQYLMRSNFQTKDGLIGLKEVAQTYGLQDFTIKIANSFTGQTKEGNLADKNNTIVFNQDCKWSKGKRYSFNYPSSYKVDAASKDELASYKLKNSSDEAILDIDLRPVGFESDSSTKVADSTTKLGNNTFNVKTLSKNGQVTSKYFSNDSISFGQLKFDSNNDQIVQDLLASLSIN